ncbi:putative nuclear RNA export factor SDE5, partial [Proteus mirabilis]|nr:putative nuclear RNA export factor SDE5 [Proteus mirabilis]
FGDRGLSRGSIQTAPLWLETEEAVANMYSGLWEGARDHARLHQVCLEQARQAFLVGNNALAKELTVKGQLHSMKMRAALEKSQEPIYHQRNSMNPESQGDRRGQERLIDLRGLDGNDVGE